MHIDRMDCPIGYVFAETLRSLLVLKLPSLMKKPPIYRGFLFQIDFRLFDLMLDE